MVSVLPELFKHKTGFVVPTKPTEGLVSSERHTVKYPDAVKSVYPVKLSPVKLNYLPVKKARKAEVKKIVAVKSPSVKPPDTVKSPSVKPPDTVKSVRPVKLSPVKLNPLPVKKVKKTPGKKTIANKMFKVTKKYDFFGDLANDMGLKNVRVVKESFNNLNVTESADTELEETIDARSESAILDTANNEHNSDKWKVSGAKTGSFDIPRKLKPGKGDCGNCDPCQTISNCQTCKFCVNPNLKKKCEARICVKKLKKQVSKNQVSNEEHAPDDLPDIAGEMNVTDDLNDNEKDGEQLKQFICKKCDKKFKFPKWLLNHMKKGCDESAIKLKHCPVCDKLVKNDYFTKHVKIHSALRVKCDKCKGSFKTVETLQAHKRSIHERKHNSDTVHECEDCEKVFKHESLLKQHISKYHKPKDFNCEDCSMTFGTKGGLRRHRKTHKSILILEMDKGIQSETDESFD